MDPLANLREQREIAQRIQRAHDGDEGARLTTIEDACRLAELAITLDEWQASGGFSPYGERKGEFEVSTRDGRTDIYTAVIELVWSPDDGFWVKWGPADDSKEWNYLTTHVTGFRLTT